MTWKILSESEATPDSFHDCHVYGIRWDSLGYQLVLYLQYIVAWIEPADKTSSYRFLVSDARLVFSNADNVKLAMAWNGLLDAQIDGLSCLAVRTSPNGTQERLFEVSFSEPDATLSLWSTGYALHLEHPPTESPTTPLDRRTQT